MCVLCMLLGVGAATAVVHPAWNENTHTAAEQEASCLCEKDGASTGAGLEEHLKMAASVAMEIQFPTRSKSQSKGQEWLC